MVDHSYVKGLRVEKPAARLLDLRPCQVGQIRSADELHKLRAGEVLVCPTTSAAWMMVFRRAGALVTDAGSVLSHTAIVAREFALPAVVATANATSTLLDGEEVIVDGSRGVVTRC